MMASRSSLTANGLALLLTATLVQDRARGAGFWFVTENRSRSDGLSGFVGRIVRGKVRSETEKGTATVLKLTKTALETGRR